jgi:hypothetical protein
MDMSRIAAHVAPASQQALRDRLNKLLEELKNRSARTSKVSRASRVKAKAI